MKKNFRNTRITKLVLLVVLILSYVTPLQMDVKATSGVRDDKYINIIDKFEVYFGSNLLISATDLTSIPTASMAVSYSEILKYEFTWSDKKLVANGDRIKYGDLVEVRIPMSEGVRYSGLGVNDEVYNGNDELIGHFIVEKLSTEYVLQMVFDNPDYNYDSRFNYEGSFYINFTLTYDVNYHDSAVDFSLNINNECYIYQLKPAGKPYPSNYRKWGELEKFSGKYTYDAINDRYYTGFSLNLNQEFNNISNSPSNPAIVHDQLDNTISDIQYELTEDGIPNITINEYTYADQFPDLADKKTAYMHHYYTYTINGNKNVCQLYSTNPNNTDINLDGTPVYSQALVDAIQFDPLNPDHFTIDLGFLNTITHPIRISYRTSISGVGMGDILNDWKNIPGASDYLKYIGNEKTNSMTLTVNGSVVTTQKSGSNTSFSTSGAEARNDYGVVRVTKYDASAPTRKLAGAEFEIYTSDNVYKHTITTDETGMVTSPNLAPGSYYIIETKAPEGFILDSQKRSFTLSASETGNHLLEIYDIPNSPCPSVKINKVSNDKTITDTTMVFELRDGTGENATVIKTLNSSNSYTAEKLQEGVYYLYEKTAPVGYELLTTYAAKFTVNSDGNIVNDEISGGTTITKVGDLSNVYTYTIPNERETGDLEFTKSTSGLSADAKATIADGTFAFLITGPDGYAETFSLPNNKSWVYSAQDLPTGEYIITETEHGTNPTGYTWSGHGTGKATLTVNATSTVKGSVTNTYTRDAGSLEFTKVITGLSADAKATIAEGTFEFSITGPDGYNETFSLPKDGSWVYSAQNLPTGEYVVTETKHGTNPTGYTWSGNGTGKATLTVNATGKGEGSITNTYTRDKGSLEFTKVITGLSADAKATIAEGTFEFSITGPNGYNETFSLPKEGSWVYSAQNLSTGTYTITETEHGTNPLGYTWSSNGTGEVTVDVNTTDIVTSSITNTYTLDTGTIKITKEIMGDLSKTDFVPESISFVLNGPETRTFQLPDRNGSWEHEESNLPIGEYTLTEQGAQRTGYNVNVSGIGDFEIKKDITKEITVINTYTTVVTPKNPTNKGPETGDSDNNIYFPLLLVSEIGLGSILIYNNKKRKYRRIKSN